MKFQNTTNEKVRVQFRDERGAAFWKVIQPEEVVDISTEYAENLGFKEVSDKEEAINNGPKDMLDMGLRELRAMAKEQDLEFPKNAKKEDLIKLLTEEQEPEGE